MTSVLLRGERDAADGRILLLLLWCLGVSLVFASTLGSMLDTWLSSETFTHGILVAPISAWLLYRMRDSIRDELRYAPALSALLLVPLFAAVWLLGRIVSVQVLMQLAFVAILVTGLVALMGLRAGRAAAFPLGFLFLMVPMGIELEQPMMDLTAKYTVKLIQLTGIPVYQEGRFFQLPTGSWSVVEACSGVRYIIASFTLGLIYAHISYSSLGKKLAFVIASLIVPVIANVLRAYLIVMIGHLSGMELATGIDHLIYGWIFFGLVMLILFWVGGWWADADQERAESGGEELKELKGREEQEAPSPGANRTAMLTLAVAMLLATIVPVSYHLGSSEAAVASLAAFEPVRYESFLCTEGHRMAWEPRAESSDRRVAFSCEGGGIFQFVADQFLTQQQGKEVADYFAGIKGDSDNRWKVLESQRESVALGSDSLLPIEISVLRSNNSGRQVLVASWYQVNDYATASALQVKFREAITKFQGDHRLSSRAYLALSVEPGDEEAGFDSIREFLRSNGEQLVAALAETSSGP